MTWNRATLGTLAAAAMLAAATVSAQAPAPAKAPLVRPVFENERVRVIEVAWEPGAAVAAAKLKPEEAIGVAGVVIKGGTIEHVQANGKKVRQERRPGDVLWEAGGARLEARQNVGRSTMQVIQVRLKKAARTRAYTGPLDGTKKVFEYAPVAAFDQTFARRVKSPMHKYGPRLWVDRKSTRLNSSHIQKSRMPSSA